MAFSTGLFCFALAFIVYVQCVPMGLPDVDSETVEKGYKLVSLYNTTSSYYNGSDLVNPLYKTVLRVATYSNSEHNLTDVTYAMKDKVSALPSVPQYVPGGVADSNGKGLVLISYQNESLLIETGPRPVVDSITQLEYEVWARQ
ncbi:uncharacterized protein LOC129001513 [Macrosteles quadrilineatus]|uniref:uncharacterized protein LOC129001513 n=1 Tax=Macrosteles quadrilineatus TaxID=74068 RepID=UPI0023E33B95|nr:uncharacterized protein LOC129001513 [Macrosteles quadrilineatus]